MSETERRTLSDRLTPEQKARLQSLVVQMEHERITVAFSIDDRDPNGRKQSAFYSDTVRRKNAEDGTPQGFSNEESRLIRLHLSRSVVQVVYDEAVKHGMFSKSQAMEELRPIMDAYDAHIATVLAGEKTGGA